MGPWTVTRSSLRMLRRVAAFCRPLRPVLLLVSFPRSWCVGAVLDVAVCAVGRQRRPVVAPPRPPKGCAGGATGPTWVSRAVAKAVSGGWSSGWEASVWRAQTGWRAVGGGRKRPAGLPVTPKKGGSKGQVWTRHCAPAAPAFTRPSLPSQFHVRLATEGPIGPLCCSPSSQGLG